MNETEQNYSIVSERTKKNQPALQIKIWLAWLWGDRLYEFK